mgnify:CR=1 FL=1|jgi:mRNA interferase MazF
MQQTYPRRGDIYVADMNEAFGSEQTGIRPVLIIQNDVGNLHCPTTIVAAITSRIKRCHIPTHIRVPPKTLNQDAIVLLEQIRTIDKRRLQYRIASLDEQTMRTIEHAIRVSLGFTEPANHNVGLAVGTQH